MSGESPHPVPLAVPFGRQVRSHRSTGELLLSAALHVGVLAALFWGGQQVIEVRGRPGEGPGLGGGGGGGGNRMFAVFTAPAAALPTPPPPALVLPTQLQVQVPVTTLPQVETPALPTPQELLRQTGAGPGQGEGTGTGAGPGSGSGTGGGIGSGRGTGVGSDSGGTGRIFPPQPQGIILPPQPAPSSLKGVRLTVRFDISERGEVLNVEVDPPIRDRGYRNEFLDRMRRYTFTPAYTLEGRPVRAIFPIQLTL